jgi:hypothetical protein
MEISPSLLQIVSKIPEKLFDGLPENIPGGEFLFTADNLDAFRRSIWEGYR